METYYYENNVIVYIWDIDKEKNLIIYNIRRWYAFNTIKMATNQRLSKFYVSHIFYVLPQTRRRISNFIFIDKKNVTIFDLIPSSFKYISI